MRKRSAWAVIVGTSLIVVYVVLPGGEAEIGRGANAQAQDELVKRLDKLETGMKDLATRNGMLVDALDRLRKDHADLEKAHSGKIAANAAQIGATQQALDAFNKEVIAFKKEVIDWAFERDDRIKWMLYKAGPGKTSGDGQPAVVTFDDEVLEATACLVRFDYVKAGAIPVERIGSGSVSASIDPNNKKNVNLRLILFMHDAKAQNQAEGTMDVLVIARVKSRKPAPKEAKKQ